MSKDSRLIIVSNRLPMTFEIAPDRVELKPSAGGLVAALGPIVKESGAAWVGATGTSFDAAIEDLLAELANQRLIPVYLTDREMQNFYNGFANEILWPLFHDLQSRCNFQPQYWHCYREVNEKFALAADSIASDDDVVWVHDYHLMLLAEAFREVSIARPRMAYFHHIPFPALNIFQKLPWRAQILRALLRFDLVLFQTAGDATNFVECVKSCLKDEACVERLQVYHLLTYADREAIATSLPISIDFESLAADAADPAVARLAETLTAQAAGNRLVLGLDRLDYTKGVGYRLQAYQHLLQSSPECHGKVSFWQITIPSRESIPQYKRLKEEVEALVTAINDEFGTRDWTPVTYMYRHLTRTELLACYCAADVAMVTPVKDGMNLVAKEYCAARNDNGGVLILSEFAGSASELGDGALLVNPYDVEGMAAALKEAFAMAPVERGMRMVRMRSRIRGSNVYDWYANFRAALGFASHRPALASGQGHAQELTKAAGVDNG